MQIILLRDRVDNKMLDLLVKELSNPDKDKTIYLSSTGGVMQVAMIIIDIINNYPANIKLIGYSDLQSAAFDIMYRVKRPKKVLPGCIGMVHMTSCDINIDERGLPYYPEDRAKMKYMKTWHAVESKAMIDSLGLDSKDVKQYMAGEPVYIQPDKMLEIFKNNDKKRSN